MTTQEKILEEAIAALEEMKAEKITTLDVRGLTSIADYLIVCSANSSRHLKALSDNLLVHIKKAVGSDVHVNGTDSSGWIIVDLGDVVVHVMSNEAREFYALEKLWARSSTDEAS